MTPPNVMLKGSIRYNHITSVRMGPPGSIGPKKTRDGGTILISVKGGRVFQMWVETTDEAGNWIMAIHAAVKVTSDMVSEDLKAKVAAMNAATGGDDDDEEPDDGCEASALDPMAELNATISEVRAARESEDAAAAAAVVEVNAAIAEARAADEAAAAEAAEAAEDMEAADQAAIDTATASTTVEGALTAGTIPAIPNETSSAVDEGLVAAPVPVAEVAEPPEKKAAPPPASKKKAAPPPTAKKKAAPPPAAKKKAAPPPAANVQAGPAADGNGGELAQPDFEVDVDSVINESAPTVAATAEANGAIAATHAEDAKYKVELVPDVMIPPPPTTAPPVGASGADEEEFDEPAFDSEERTDRILLSGWMVKRGDVARNWKKRWFEASSQVVAYYTKPEYDGGQLKGGVLPETITSVEVCSINGRNDVLEVVTAAVGKTKSRRFYFHPPGPAECDAWLAVLRDVGGLVDSAEDTAARIEAAVSRRTATFGGGLRALFKNFDKNGKGRLPLRTVSTMYKLLTLVNADQVAADCAELGSDPSDQVTMDQFIQLVVSRNPDSAVLDERLALAATIRPMEQVDAASHGDGGLHAEPRPEKPLLSPEIGLEQLFKLLDEDDESDAPAGEIEKSDGFDVLADLLPSADLATLRGAFQNSTITKAEFMSFALQNGIESAKITEVTKLLRAELG